MPFINEEKNHRVKLLFKKLKICAFYFRRTLGLNNEKLLSVVKTGMELQ
jgi:hypothetical protein